MTDIAKAVLLFALFGFLVLAAGSVLGTVGVKARNSL